ncbi:MAG TPA: hypothetical protein VEV43_10700 [Actinomycetota bacterium]|nr:hypothetical protein [Actinomycetota bacterium]
MQSVRTTVLPSRLRRILLLAVAGLGGSAVALGTSEGTGAGLTPVAVVLATIAGFSALWSP